MNYIIFGSVLVALGILYIIGRKFVNKHFGIISKIVSIVLFACFFMWNFASQIDVFSYVVGLTDYNFFSSKFVCAMSGITLWLTFASMVILQLVGFFKFDVLKNFAKTFCFFVSVLQIAFLQPICFGLNLTYDITLGSIFFSIETAIAFLYCLYFFISNKYFKISKTDLIEMAKLLPVVLFFSIPPFLPRLLFGNIGQMLCKGFGLYHRIYLYLSFFVIFWLLAVLKNKDKEYSRMVLLFISLVSLISYVFRDDFSIFVTPTSWPLHLCNTAMYILPLCLMFKWDKLFYFTLFINVLGAFLAMLIPNYSDTSFVSDPGIVRFWINHINAFAMPVVTILTGVFKRPKLKQFIYSMVAFLCYFVLVLILNAWFTASGTPTDFFFINSDFITSKLGTWADNLRNAQFTISIAGRDMLFYPLYQVLFFLTYVAFGLAMWFVFVYLFQIQDFYKNLSERQRKIKLDEVALCVKYGEKEINNCMNEESKGKLVIKNASKKYGSSTVFSLKDASFEVCEGEILGFLGPNGAGKSTMIKSIVGMQPLTNGTIEVNGYDVEKQPVLAKTQLGFVPDHYALYENLTGREYVNYIADLFNVSKEERDERLNKLVSQLQMEASFDNQIKTYSHGMKQKIAIMSALVHNPKLWILDEPLTGLDPNSIHQVKECMKEHAKNGNIVFFSSHIIDIVEKLCDRIIIIKKGKICAEAKMNDLKKNNIELEKFYLDIINKQDVEEEIVESKEEKDKKKKKLIKRTIDEQV